MQNKVIDYKVFQKECGAFKGDIYFELVTLLNSMNKQNAPAVMNCTGNLLVYCANFCKDNELELDNVMALSNLKFNSGYRVLFDELLKEIIVLSKDNIQLVVHILQLFLKNRSISLEDCLKSKL